jgi:hypothetical protein
MPAARTRRVGEDAGVDAEVDAEVIKKAFL